MISGTSLSFSTYSAATNTNTSLNDATTGKSIDRFNYSTGWTHSTCGSSDACYDGDNTWSTTTNATATVTFTGTQMNLYAVLAPVHGLVGVELCNSSGGSCSTETPVNLYAPLHAGDQLVWVSPVKSSSTYKLKLIVPGAHDNYATSNAVTIDRVTMS